MQGTTQAKARLGAFGAMAVGIALVVCLASLAGCGSDKVQAGNDAKNAALTVDGSMSRWDIVCIGSQWFEPVGGGKGTLEYDTVTYMACDDGVIRANYTVASALEIMADGDDGHAWATYESGVLTLHLPPSAIGTAT